MTDRERALLAGLRRLAAETKAPPIDASQEQRLLAAFDAHWSPRLARTRARSGQALRRSSGQAAAVLGLLAAAATLLWMVSPRDRRAHPQTAAPAAPVAATIPPPAVAAPHQLTPPAAKSARVRKPQTPRAATADTTFVMWPGASDLPRFESGQLMRVELPASVAASLGLRPQRVLNDAGAGSFVQTDVLVGQDGYARAVRLVQR